jgi:phosphatidylglycerol:prolipoprotein diacylglycerol transferase
MHSEIAKIGGVTIYSHGVFVALAIIIAATFFYFLAKKRNLESDRLIDNITSIILVGIISARIAWVIINYDQLQSFVEIFYIWQGGLTSWGGFLAGFLTALLLFRKEVKRIELIDIFFLCGLLGVAIGRIGCYLTGDIITIPTENYPAGFPVAGLELILAFALFAIIFTIYFRYQNLVKGLISLQVLFGYSLIRLFIDGYRDEASLFLNFKLSQVVSFSVLLLIIVVFIFFIFNIKRKRNG